jgi:two-component system, repressor protein LuxO
VRNVVVLQREGEWVDASMLPPPVVRGGAAFAPVPFVPPPPLQPAAPAAPALAAPAAWAGEPVPIATEPTWATAAPVAVAERMPVAPPAPAPIAALPTMPALPVTPAAAPVAAPAPVLPEEPEIMPLAVMERRLILAALRHTNSDVPRAAALLQINPSTVYRKLQSWRTEGLPDNA